MTPAGQLDDQVPCPECGALNLPDAKFCADCGCMLVKPARAEGDRPARPAARRRFGTVDAVEKSRARQEFARTKSIVVTIRLVYWSCAILALLYVAMWHTALATTAGKLGPWYLPITVLV